MTTSAAPREGPSWLTLERYLLGELEGPARGEVEQQLATSERARAMHAAICGDRSTLPARPRLRTSPCRAVWSALAVAASVLVWHVPHAAPAPSGSSSTSKGDALALSLFSELTGSEPRSFGEGERFKLFYTCPPELAEPARVVLFQGGERFEPLVPLPTPACGNQQPWPGAFRLSGRDTVLVCVAFGEVADQVRSSEQLPARSVCSQLTPLR